MADKVATYTIKTDSNAAEIGREGAAGLEALRSKIQASKGAIGELGSALRSLRGSSDEVKAAKAQLGAQLEAERGAVSAATLELAKQGVSYDKLAAAEKKAAAEKTKLDEKLKNESAKAANDNAEAFGKGLKGAGGPAGELAEKLESLKTALSSSAGMMALAGAAVATLVVGVVALTAAIASAAYGFASWIVEAGGAQRSAELLRKAWTGNATDAAHLGHQVELLASKVPTAKDELNRMAGEIVRSMNGTRVGGQAMIDTFNAVAQASAAMGDTAGKKIQEIVERAKNTGRVSIGLFELQGTGVTRDDVATQLAKRMHVGVAAARTALMQGRVSVGDAAAALRAAVEARFGEINVANMFDPQVLKRKFQEAIGALTKDVKLQPLLDAFKSLGKLFDANSISGRGLKAIIEAFGNRLGPALQGQVPKIRELFIRLEVGAIRAEIFVIKLSRAIDKVFGPNALGRLAGAMFDSAIAQAKSFADGLERISKTLEAIGKWADAHPNLMGAVFGKGGAGASKERVAGAKAGAEINAGIKEGLLASLGGPVGAMGEVLKKIIDAARHSPDLDAHSPSRAYEKLGKTAPEGLAKGMASGARAAGQAAAAMVPATPKTAGSGAGKGSQGRAMAPVTIHVNLHAGNKEAAQALQAPTFLKQITKALEDALVVSGLPVQTAAKP